MKQYLLFEVNKKKYGLDIEYVSEIKRNITFSKILTNNKCIIGVHNLRNRIVTILDSDMLINNVEGTRTGEFVIIFKTKNKKDPFALEVSNVRDILGSEDLKEVDMPFDESDETHVIKRVLKLDKEIIQLIDYDQLIKKIFKEER